MTRPEIRQRAEDLIEQLIAGRGPCSVQAYNHAEGGMMPTETQIVHDFICALLDPLPEGIPVDTQYNALMRRSRRATWWPALINTNYRHSRMEYLANAMLYASRVEGDQEKAAKLRDDHTIAVKAWRQAVTEQILTPAPTRADVAWKRSAAKDRFLPISAAEIEAAIIADEAFLAAHPVNCRKPRPSTGGGRVNG